MVNDLNIEIKKDQHIKVYTISHVDKKYKNVVINLSINKVDKTFEVICTFKPKKGKKFNSIKRRLIDIAIDYANEELKNI